MDNLYQVPPQNIELELSILNECLYQPSDVVFDILKPDDFYRTAHQKIFEACRILHGKKEPIDINSAATILRDKNYLEDIGGLTYLSQILDYPKPINSEYSAKKLKGYSQLRKTIEVCNSTAKKCFNAGSDDIESILNFAHSEILKINLGSHGIQRDIYDSSRMVEEYQQYIETLKNNRFITGISEIDRRIRGVAGGEVLTIIARAGSFKTAMLQHLLLNYCQNSAWGAIFFSIEMPVQNVTERYFCMLDGCTGKEVEAMFASPDMQSPRDKAIDQFVKDLSKLYIVPSKISLKDIPKYIQIIENKYNHKIGVIGVDYLGLIDAPGNNEYETISRIAKEIKVTAKLINLPVVLLSQVSRKGGDGEIEISLDMGRGSGAIEEGADFVLGLWQIPNTDEYADRDYDLICRILKNRKGPKGSRWNLEIEPTSFQFSGNATEYVSSKKQPKAVGV